MYGNLATNEVTFTECVRVWCGSGSFIFFGPGPGPGPSLAQQWEQC